MLLEPVSNQFIAAMSWFETGSSPSFRPRCRRSTARRIGTRAVVGLRRTARWARKGRGKSGGVRVIYYNRLENGKIRLLTIYTKSDRSTVPAHELKLIKEMIDRD